MTSDSEGRGAAHGNGAAEAAVRRSSPWLTVLAFVLSGALGLVLFGTAAAEWREFRLPDDMNIDLAWFNQGFYRAVHDHGWIASTVSEMGSSAIIGVHFSPVFYLAMPFYIFWQSPLLLMLVSAFGVATMGIMVMLLARRLYGGTLMALVWFGFFALYPPVRLSIFTDGFRELYLAMGFLSLALLFYIEERYGLFFLMLIPAILSKEDVSLLIPMWGVVAALQRRGRRLAVSLILLGIASFVLINAVALPIIRHTPIGRVYFVGFQTSVGGTPEGMFHSLLTRPLDLVRLFVSRDAVAFWAAYLSPLLFLPVLGWEYLIIPAYLYAETALQHRPIAVPVRYLAPSFPFIFVAAEVGMLRLLAFVRRTTPLRSRPARRANAVVLSILVCCLAAPMFHLDIGGRVVNAGTPFPSFVGDNWLGNPRRSQDELLGHALDHMPREAAVAASLSLISQISSRPQMYYLGLGGPYIEDAMTHRPDYLAFDLRDLDAPHIRFFASLLCRGTYGVVYEDNIIGYGRLLLTRGADLSANALAYHRYFPEAHETCPDAVQQVTSDDFARATHIHVRRVPSKIGSFDTFPEPVAARPDHRFVQVIHLPDHTFEAGWYRLDLTGAWPWPWIAASSRVTMRVLVGDRAVGQVTAGSDQPLRYVTPPFHIDRPVTLPMRVEADLSAPDDRQEPIFALRPAPAGCALVADAPSLNPPQQVTVDALVYIAEIPSRPGADIELPILSKNDASGYYLRLSGDARGRVWVDFNVAGAWSLGQAAVNRVSLHRWTAIAATYDGREAKIYVDGAQALQDPSRDARHTGAIQSQGPPLVIGCRAAQSAVPVVFPGLIASARVWNRALTPQEIHDVADTEILSGSEAGGLVGSWGFQSVEEGAIVDLSGARNVITNGTALTRVPQEELKPPLSAWQSRELNLLRLAAVTAVPSARVREQFPSDLRHDDLFPETLTLPSDRRYTQMIHLPHHTFQPGRYRIDLTGTGLLPWVPATYQVTARVFVGDQIVGAAAVDGGRPLRYTTPPFTVDRRETRPVRVQVDMRIPEGRPGQAWALRPAREGCAIVADAPSLNPQQQVTVEALTYLDEIPKRPGTEVELPILSKNNAPGYYLRLSSDDRGRVWAEFNVAGKWVLARADAGAAALRRWMALAATYDGQDAKIYINGYQAPQAPGRSPRFAGSIRGQGAPLAIGCRDPKQAYEVVFPGLIAGARVWNRALSLQEIRDGERTWVLPSTAVAGLVGSWGLQSGEEKSDAGTVPDLSPAGNPIVNGAQLTRAPMPPVERPFAGWYSRDVTVLERVVVRSVVP